METKLQPTETIFNGEVPGFRVGREFVPMLPHKGHVGMLKTASGRYRFVKSGNNKAAEYRSNRYVLEIRLESQQITKEELFCVVKSEAQRLVIIDNTQNIFSETKPPLPVQEKKTQDEYEDYDGSEADYEDYIAYEEELEYDECEEEE